MGLQRAAHTLWLVPILAWMLINCGGDTSRDSAGSSQGDVGTGGQTGGGSGGQSGDAGTTPGSPGFESQAWRASLDHSDEGRPWIVNRAVHGTSAADMFVVGSFGRGIDIDFCFVDHLVGDAWEPVQETGACLSGVWAASPSLIFGVGAGVVRIEVSEATAQGFVANTSLSGVWGWSEDNVLAVGVGGTIIHFDGADWTREESGSGADLEAVWGSDQDNVFAVGDGGTILTRAGGVWSTMESGTFLELNDVWGSGPSDVYAVGGMDGDPGHVILHYDGTRWSTVNTGDDRVSALLGVSGRSASDVCAVGAYRDATGTAHALVLHFDGSAWRELPVQAEAFLWDVWPVGADAYLVVGPDDTLATVQP